MPPIPDVPALVRGELVELRAPAVEHVDPIVEAVTESLAELKPWMPWATDAYELTQVKPHLAGLLEPSRRPAGVDLVYSVESARGLNFVFRLPHNAGGEP